MEATVCCRLYYRSEIEVVRTKIIVQSTYTSAIERSLLKWNGHDCDGSMHYSIGFYCCHVTTFWNLIGTANFQAAEVTVWTCGSCQAVSPMAWERGYGLQGLKLFPEVLAAIHDPPIIRPGNANLVYPQTGLKQWEWRPYKIRWLVAKPIHAKGQKWATQFQPRSFYSTAMLLYPVGAPTHLPLSHPFCSRRIYH